jgi:signal transduction histidine kinase
MSSLPAELDRLLHDLRGPLNSAVMHLEVLRRLTVSDPSAKQSLDTLHEQLQRLAIMLPVAFDVVALELGPTRRLSLDEVVAAAVREVGGDVTVAEGPWPCVEGDERLLTVAVAHLLRNAIEATRAAAVPRPAPRVNAVVSSHGEAVLTVRDWGIGLKSTNAKILTRLTAGASGIRPRGVGLLTAERVARLHGGELRFLAPGDGAEVSLSLPLEADSEGRAHPDKPT